MCTRKLSKILKILLHKNVKTLGVLNLAYFQIQSSILFFLSSETVAECETELVTRGVKTSVVARLCWSLATLHCNGVGDEAR